MYTPNIHKARSARGQIHLEIIFQVFQKFYTLYLYHCSQTPNSAFSQYFICSWRGTWVFFCSHFFRTRNFSFEIVWCTLFQNLKICRTFALAERKDRSPRSLWGTQPEMIFGQTLRSSNINLQTTTFDYNSETKLWLHISCDAENEVWCSTQGQKLKHTVISIITKLFWDEVY